MIFPKQLLCRASHQALAGLKQEPRLVSCARVKADAADLRSGLHSRYRTKYTNEMYELCRYWQTGRNWLTLCASAFAEPVNPKLLTQGVPQPSKPTARLLHC